MAETKRYNVEINGMQTVLKLSADSAKKRGLTDKDLVKPAAKGRSAANKAAPTPANKDAASGADKS